MPDTVPIETDTNRIAATERFFDFIRSNPSDQLASTFKELLRSDQAPSRVNSFFETTAPPEYRPCTFVSSMTVISTRARTQGQQTVYSLSALCNSFGGEWPAGFPDIPVSNFTFSNDNNTFVMRADIELHAVPFAPEATPFIRSMLPSVAVPAELEFHHGLDTDFSARITFRLPNLPLVPGAELSDPKITLDIKPSTTFAVLTAKATMSFSLFDQNFGAKVLMVITKKQAEISTVVDGDPGATVGGVHFKKFGVGMGLFFEPPAYALGVQGQFQIGDGSDAEVDDDQFAVVCKLRGSVPEPVYVSFYVKRMNIDKVITVFTSSSPSLGIPIDVTDLAFHWALKPRESVILPDGTESKKGYGFRGTFKLLEAVFHGDVEISTSGMHGLITMAPLSLPPLTGILKLTGNGSAIEINVDANGDPIKNNEIATSSENQSKVAGKRTLVEAGGPVLSIGSDGLKLNAGISLFGKNTTLIDTRVDSGGIASFALDAMDCAMTNFETFAGKMSVHVHEDVPLSVGPIDLGSIPLDLDVAFTVNISTSGTTMRASFEVAGHGFSFNLDPSTNIPGFTELRQRILEEVRDQVKRFFTTDAANFALTALLAGADMVAAGLKAAFGRSAEEIASVLSGAGHTAEEIGSALRSVFDCGGPDGDQHLFYRDRDGWIQHSWWDGSQKEFHGPDQWNKIVQNAPAAAGDPAVMVFGKEQHLFYPDRDGWIQHIYWDDDGFHGPDVWNHDGQGGVEAPRAWGSPAVMATPKEQHLFYKDDVGWIHHIVWDGSLHGPDSWNMSLDAPRAAGDPAAVYADGGQHLFYRDGEGLIQHIWYANGGLNRDVWNRRPEGVDAPRAAGDPAVMATANEQHVFYRDGEGWIHHIWWNGHFNGPDSWNMLLGAPRAAGDPTAMATSSGEQHLFYRDTEGVYQHIYWDRGTLRRDQWGDRAKLVGDPAAMFSRG